ncbi:MAG: hypothetical protein M3Z10_00185 [Gemmatimonadota bacterium]|nr:hypothetical protein [Gemmatimonadota bacterium]
MDRALERDAKLRYQTANEFGRALYAALATMDPAGAGGEARTSVIEAVPPTRVGEAVSAPVKRRRRGPILIGTGMVAFLVAGLAYVQQNGNAERVVPSPRPAPVVIDDSVPTSLAGTATQKRETPAPVAPASASTDLGPRVADLVQRSGDSLAARQVLNDVRNLESRATSDADRAGLGLGLARAQALAYLDRQGDACSALHSVHKLSTGTKYQSKIDRLLQYTSC